MVGFRGGEMIEYSVVFKEGIAARHPPPLSFFGSNYGSEVTEKYAVRFAGQ